MWREEWVEASDERQDEIRQEVVSCLDTCMVETLRKDFNANRLCLHKKDLTNVPFVYERVLWQDHCVKVRLVRFNDQPVSLKDYVREWRTLCPETNEHWNSIFKKQSLNRVVDEVCSDVVGRAKLGTFPCVEPCMDSYCFKNGTLHWDGTDLVFKTGEWIPSLYFFDCNYDREETILPYFDSIFESQGIGTEQKKYIMAQFGRLLSRQGNEWRCFVMLFGKTSNGKTCLVDLFASFFEDTDRWCLDGSMDPRWVGHYVVRKKLVYYRDAAALSKSLSCNQLLQLAGNEEVVSELKLQNNATLSRAQHCRLFRVGNDGWQVENVWATVQRAFCIEFNKTIPAAERDPFLPIGLASEAPWIAAECIKAFYSFYPTMQWHDKPWHRLPLIKSVYTRESRATQHCIATQVEDGVWDFDPTQYLTVRDVDCATVAFCNSSRRVCGPPIYHFVSITRLGWSEDQAPFGVWVDEEQVFGIKML